MGFINELINPKPITIELAAQTSQEPGAKSVKATPEVNRIVANELEYAYITDPINFHSINLATQMIMAAGYEIISNNEETKRQFIEFFDSIGKVGEDITFDELLEEIFRYQMIYGNAYVELVFDKRTDSRIVDLTLIDSKRMDYAKTSNGQIVLDKYGKPVGYILKLPWDISETNRGDEIPREYKNKISLSSNEIFLLPRRICHFKLYTYGDRFYGLGLIEPAYKSILYKQNIEESQANAIYQRGHSPVIAYVGDSLHEPTPNMIKTVLDNLVKLKSDRYTSFPYYVKVETIEAKQSDIVQDTLKYLRRNQVSSLGVPEAIATGIGEETNRATLRDQLRMLEYTLNDIVNKTLSTFRKYILNRILLYNKIDGNIDIKWREIGASEDETKIRRIIDATKVGIYSADEAKEYIKKLENFD